MRKISAGRGGRERYYRLEMKIYIGAKILMCVLFLKKYIISSIHQTLFHANWVPILSKGH